MDADWSGGARLERIAVILREFDGLDVGRQEAVVIMAAAQLLGLRSRMLAATMAASSSKISAGALASRAARSPGS